MCIRDRLKTYNQEHIINLLEKINEEQEKDLIEQISNIDFHQMKELILIWEIFY